MNHERFRMQVSIDISFSGFIIFLMDKMLKKQIEDDGYRISGGGSKIFVNFIPHNSGY